MASTWPPSPETIESLKTLGILGGLVFAGAGFFLNAFATFKSITTRRLLNYQELMKSHRDLWKLTLDRPEVYARILDPHADLTARPIGDAERRFVNLLLLHITTAHAFSRKGDIVKIEQLEKDVEDVLSLPIPRQVWRESRHYFNKAFIAFVERPRTKMFGSRRGPRPWSYTKQWNILVLTGFKSAVVSTLSRDGDKLLFPADLAVPISVEYLESNDVDLIVSFGYGLILGSQVLARVTAINVHPGLLPENRGPNPHLWSTLGRVQRGVTIHYMDTGVDTGDIIARREFAEPGEDMSFRESFELLIADCALLLEQTWAEIRAGRNERLSQPAGGRTYTFGDQAALKPLFEPDGLDLIIPAFRARATELLRRGTATN